MTQFDGYLEEVILNAYDYSNPNYDLYASGAATS